jgi:SAM-dependent methyltransferase
MNSEFAYNGEVADWWLHRSRDPAHRRAYRKIADFIQASYTRAPKTIVDYACGPGNLISLLSRRFPYSKLMGLDGSSFLLNIALRRISRLPRHCSERISLIETPLPSLDLPFGKADLAIFCFPNMTPFFSEEEEEKQRNFRSRSDWMIAAHLAPDNPAALLQSRCISHNLRKLLKPGGICVRVEYATVQRHELSPSELLQVSYEEGSLDSKVGGRMPRQWFRLLASAYFSSQVLEDVYQQTGDDRDRNGGYLITVLRGI